MIQLTIGCTIFRVEFSDYDAINDASAILYIDGAQRNALSNQLTFVIKSDTRTTAILM